jgi:mannose/cellobiose epimerase-like protein (N-acyl-D-glucosamine 2-epimerase family)
MKKCALLRRMWNALLNPGCLQICRPARYVKVSTPRPLSSYSVEMRKSLVEKILPYWHDTTLDLINGGYILSDDAKEKRTATEKQVVTQSRLIWTFSHVHRKGYSTPQYNYLKAAEHGYRFLIDKYLDKNNGGYFWTTDLRGNVLNDWKILYGQAFVIYCLVEYHRASNNQDALRHSMELYDHLQQYAHDRKNAGWAEHFTRDWQAILYPRQKAVVGVIGCKCANTHLHLMEALTELFNTTLENEVRQSLHEVVRLNATYFYPMEARKSCSVRQFDWKELVEPKFSGISYGHNVEFAWLMIRAQKALGTPVAWDHFYAHVNHALKYGYDHERGGLYNSGKADKAAVDTDKVWWCQAEMLATLTEALEHKFNAEYESLVKGLLDFVARFMTDPSDGIWLDTVTAEGKFKDTRKAHNWKANYHDVRAMVMFIEAFQDHA